MPVYQLALFAATIAILMVLTVRSRTPALAVLVVAAFGFGLVNTSSLTQTARSMTDGFLAALATAAPLLLAATLIERLQARAWKAPAPHRPRSLKLALLGGVGGLGLYAEATLSALLGLVLARTPARGKPMAGDAARLALPLFAAHALLPPAPGPMAVLSIIGADPWQILPWSLLFFAAAVAAALLFVAWATRGEAVDLKPGSGGTDAQADERPPAGGRGAAAVAFAGCAALLLLSLAGPYAALPGPWRPAWYHDSVLPDIVVALAQPFTLLVVVIAVVGGGSLLIRRGGKPPGDWERAFVRGGELAMLVGAAGTLAGVLQFSMLGEMLADAFSGWPLSGAPALAIPFAIAFALRTVLGAELPALITAASIAQPLLAPLGLADDSGRTLVALAICAGTLAVCHVNDSTFWITTGMARAGAREGWRLLTLGSLVQAGVAAALLFLVAQVML